ncbi:MAG: DUF350 domain-containing protein [Gammaproteobacteria bacterium]|nr:DUF350 domain-containing protein [Gammaproteobacteria bacterium]
MNDLIGIDPSLAAYYAVDFLIIAAILAGMRKLAGAVGNVSSHAELSERDNHAFGISLAGAAIAIAIMLMGAVSGEAAKNPASEALIMFAYGGLGLALMAITRKIFDHISLPDISIHNEIMKGNTAAALVDAGNMIATAIILRAVMVWVDSNSFSGLLFVLGGFLISQVIMIAATVYRRHVYARHHGEMGLQKQLENGNTALALRFAGYRIGIALAVTAASGIVVYGDTQMIASLTAWSVVAVLMFIVLTALAILIRKAVLPGINVAEEVNQQGNIAIGAIESAVYIAVGFLLAGLFG